MVPSTRFEHKPTAYYIDLVKDALVFLKVLT